MSALNWTFAPSAHSPLTLCLLPCFSSSPNHTLAIFQPRQTSWPQTLGTLRPWKEWYSFALVGVVWSFCQVEALPHPFLSLMYVCWRLLLMCLLWLVLGGCIRILECCLWQKQKQVSAATQTESLLTLSVCFTGCCLFTDFSLIQGRGSTEDRAGGSDWKQD